MRKASWTRGLLARAHDRVPANPIISRGGSYGSRRRTSATQIRRTTVAVAAKRRSTSGCRGNTALAQAAIYLATAPKSNAVYEAYNRAAADAQTDIAEPVPLHLRNAPTKLMKELAYGKGYAYAHEQAEGVADMTCLPPALEGRRYYQPTERG
jgi:replication-associated recombination protein RarA